MSGRACRCSKKKWNNLFNSLETQNSFKYVFCVWKINKSQLFAYQTDLLREMCENFMLCFNEYFAPAHSCCKALLFWYSFANQIVEWRELLYVLFICNGPNLIKTPNFFFKENLTSSYLSLLPLFWKVIRIVFLFFHKK